MYLKNNIFYEFKKISLDVKARLVEQKEDNDEYLFNSGYQLCLIKTLDLLMIQN